jgi:sigma-E factor negative regulatory protein RseA
MTQNSSDPLYVSLSAMVDDEANELEVHRVLKNLEQDEELLGKWRRYHLIGSVMRGESRYSSSLEAQTLSASIAREIHGESSEERILDAGLVRTGLRNSASEPGQQTGGLHQLKNSSFNWKDFIGKSGIAASVAAIFVIGFNVTNQSSVAVGQDPLMASNSSVQAPAASVNHAPVGFELPMPEAKMVSLSNGFSGANISRGMDYRSHSVLPVDDISDSATQDLLNQLLILHAERASGHGSLGIMPFARVHKMLQTETSAASTR